MPNEMREYIEEALGEYGEVVTWDGCDAAIIGIVERCGQAPLVCYDYE